MKPATVIVRAHEAYIPFLPRALASLKAQVTRDFDTIIAFDGPAPEFPPEVEALGRELGAVVMATGEQTGYYAIPCNRVIPHVRTPWIAFLDADNEFAPDHLVSLLAAARKGNPRPGFVYSRRRYVRDPGCDARLPVAVGESPFIPWTPENRARLATGPAANFIDSGDLLVGKGVFYWLAHDTGWMFDESRQRFGDWDLARRLSLLGVPGAAVDAATSIYHWHGGNLQLTRPVQALRGLTPDEADALPPEPPARPPARPPEDAP